MTELSVLIEEVMFSCVGPKLSQGLYLEACSREKPGSSMKDSQSHPVRMRLKNVGRYPSSQREHLTLSLAGSTPTSQDVT